MKTEHKYFVLSFITGLVAFGITCYMPECVTKCGLRVDSTPYSCEDIQRAEDETLKRFADLPDTRLHTCKNFNGYKVITHDEINFTSLGRLVSGRTFCGSQEVHINGKQPNKSSLPHELAHVMQDCYPLDPQDPDDPDHSNWYRDGIYDAIRSVQEAY